MYLTIINICNECLIYGVYLYINFVANNFDLLLITRNSDHMLSTNNVKFQCLQDKTTNQISYL